MMALVFASVCGVAGGVDKYLAGKVQQRHTRRFGLIAVAAQS
jgi:hypothetical protein